MTGIARHLCELGASCERCRLEEIPRSFGPPPLARGHGGFSVFALNWRALAGKFSRAERKSRGDGRNRRHCNCTRPEPVSVACSKCSLSLRSIIHRRALTTSYSARASWSRARLIESRQVEPDLMSCLSELPHVRSIEQVCAWHIFSGRCQSFVCFRLEWASPDHRNRTSRRS